MSRLHSSFRIWQNEPKVPPPGGATLRLGPLRDTTLIAGFGRTNPKEALFARRYQTAQPPPHRASCIAHEREWGSIGSHARYRASPSAGRHGDVVEAVQQHEPAASLIFVRCERSGPTAPDGIARPRRDFAAAAHIDTIVATTWHSRMSRAGCVPFLDWRCRLRCSTWEQASAKSRLGEDRKQVTRQDSGV